MSRVMETEKDYGEPLKYDPDFAGPVRNRSCTDVVWLLIFLVFLAGWIYVGVHGMQRGDVKRLLAPSDTQGHRCGLDSGFEGRPYLVFFDITQCARPDAAITGCNTTQVCVERCPSASILFSSVLNPNHAIFEQMVCQYHVNKASINSLTQMQHYIRTGECASYVLDSQSVLGRCIGSDLSILSCDRRPSARATPVTVDDETCLRDPRKARASVLSRANALDTYVGLVAAGWVAFFTRSTPQIQNVGDLLRRDKLSTRIVEDLVSARWYMLGAVAAVILVCFVYVVLLRWVVAPVVWFSLIGMIALLSFGCYKCWYNWKNFTEGLPTWGGLLGWLEEMFNKKETWLALLIITALVTIILLLIVIFLRNRITIAIALIKEGSKAVNANKTTVAYPLLPWLLQCLLVSFSVVSLVFLLSVGESRYVVVGLTDDTDCQCITGTNFTDGVDCIPSAFDAACKSITTGEQCINASCHFKRIDNPTYISYFIFVNVLGFFWTMFFVQGMADLTLAGTFSQWYWTFDKRSVPFFSLTGAVYRSVRYHMGTVAFGSFIIAVVRLIRLFLEYVDRKLKKYDNSFVKCVLCACKCCFWCLENFIKFINKNAYIMCAVHGGSFCKSARDAFSLLMRNIVRVFVLDKVTDFIFFMSKLLIAGGTGAAVYYLTGWNYFYNELGADRLHYNAVPAVVLAVVAYFVATLFFNVYSMAVHTLFLCFLEDCERNDGSPERPYYMSKNLMKILGKKNKIQ